jgi:hypothetical protein
LESNPAGLLFFYAPALPAAAWGFEKVAKNWSKRGLQADGPKIHPGLCAIEALFFATGYTLADLRGQIV